PPQGKFSEENLKQAQELGYTTVFWSLAYVDWYTDNQPTDEQAFAKLIPRIHNGAIVLLHSTSETNARILDELLTRWENEGYTFDSLTDLAAGCSAYHALPQRAAPNIRCGSFSTRLDSHLFCHIFLCYTTVTRQDKKGRNL